MKLGVRSNLDYSEIVAPGRRPSAWCPGWAPARPSRYPGPRRRGSSPPRWAPASAPPCTWSGGRTWRGLVGAGLQIRICSKLRFEVIWNIEISTYLEISKYHKSLYPESSVKVAAFWENPENFDQILANFSQNSGKICNFWQNQQKWQQLLTNKWD